MALQLRQPIEGDRVLSVQGISDTGHTSGGNYIPNSISVFINNVEYPLSSINSIGFGFASFNTPIPLKANDLVRVQSNYNSETTNIFTVRPTNFNIVAVDATICNNTSEVTVSYNDIIRLFLEDINSEFTLFLNGNSLSLSNFVYQQYQTSTFSSDGLGKFKGTSNTNNSSALSINNYAPNNILTITPKAGYFVVRLGIVELIFNKGTLRRTNFAAGEFDVSTGIIYNPDDVFVINSTNSNYTVTHNNIEIYTYSKSITLTTTGGTISPNPATINVPSIWTLPTTPGIQTVTAEFLGGGIFTSININVQNCKGIADNKTVNVVRGTNNNAIPILTGTIPNNCSDGGFQITSLPSCVTLRLSGVAVTLNQIIPTINAGNLTVDVPTACSSIVTFNYIKLVTGSGCSNSDPAVVTINPSSCTPTWVNVGSPECIDCKRVQLQENTTQSCSGGPSTRYLELGDNTLCIQPEWEDTELTRCNNCQEEKFQLNINPCYTGTQGRWVNNPGGNSCSSLPVWTLDSTTCAETATQYDIRRTSLDSSNTNPGWIQLFNNGGSDPFLSIKISAITKNGYSIKPILDTMVSNTNTVKGTLYIKISDGAILTINITSLSYNSSGNYYGGAIQPAYFATYATNIDAIVYFQIEGTSRCQTINIEKDTNICSPTYGDTRLNFGTTSCPDKPAYWIFNGDISCQDCENIVSEKDIEICSPTYDQSRNSSTSNEYIDLFYLFRSGFWGAEIGVMWSSLPFITGQDGQIRLNKLTYNLINITNLTRNFFLNNQNVIDLHIIDPNSNIRVEISNVYFEDYIDGNNEVPIGGTVTYSNAPGGNIPWGDHPFIARFILNGTTICDTSQNLITTNEFECINCQEKEYFIDANPCSSTYNKIYLKDRTSPGTSCNILPEYVVSNEYQCTEQGIHQVKHVNINPCYTGTDQFIWIPTGLNLCKCEKTINIKNICNDKDIIAVYIRRNDIEDESNRLISYTNNKLTFTTDFGEFDYNITVTNSSNISSIIIIKIKCNKISNN